MMPSYEMFTREFAKEVLRGDKKLLKRSEVKWVEVMKYDELSVKQLYDKLLALPMMKDYFPNKYPKGRCCDRDYMFNVANTLHEEVVTELVEHALNQRHAPDGIKMQDESVLINEHWANELKSLPMISHVSTISRSGSCANIVHIYRKKERWSPS